MHPHSQTFFNKIFYNPGSFFRAHGFVINRMVVAGFFVLTACTQAIPTILPIHTPIASPIPPSFLSGTEDLNCTDMFDNISPRRQSGSYMFPGGHSQFYVGRYKDGRPFLFASGVYNIAKSQIEFAYRCPYPDAEQLFKELGGQ